MKVLASLAGATLLIVVYMYAVSWRVWAFGGDGDGTQTDQEASFGTQGFSVPSYDTPVDMARCIALTDEIPDFTGNLVEKGGNPSFYYFLHVPRVSGRTLNNCFMRAMFKTPDKCFDDYGNNAHETSGPLNDFGYHCKLRASHHDLSFVESLPKDAAVFTQIRDPVGRVISSYEFSARVSIRTEETRQSMYLLNRKAPLFASLTSLCSFFVDWCIRCLP